MVTGWQLSGRRLGKKSLAIFESGCNGKSGNAKKRSGKNQLIVLLAMKTSWKFTKSIARVTTQEVYRLELDFKCARTSTSV